MYLVNAPINVTWNAGVPVVLKFQNCPEIWNCPELLFIW